MAVSVEQAREELRRQSGAPPVSATANSTTVLRAPHAPANDVAPRFTAGKLAGQPGVNPMDFVAANRIQVKDGSLFVDPYLAIHPRELDPKNEAALRAKLRLTFGINNPSFYEAPERVSIAVNLGQLIPVSAAAKRSKLVEAVNQFNTEVKTGADAELQKQLADKQAPFSAIVRDTVNSPATDPVGMEVLKNGLGLYLLLREKLTQQGYLNPLTDYVLRSATPDQVLADLGPKLGVTPLAFRQAALSGGLDGVGRLLGLAPAYIADVNRLMEHAAGQDFGYNQVEHWHLGRQLLGIDAPLEQKIATGMDARITAKIDEYRRKIRHHYEVPSPVAVEEKRIAQALELVEPVQRALMYRLGYEICYSPEVTADDIAFHKGIYGLHRKAANDLRDVQGTYRIYFSGKGDLKGSMRTLVHEVAHNLWPEEFTPAEAAKIDVLASSDKQRFDDLETLMQTHFTEFERLMNAYKAGSPAEQAAIAASAGELFKNAAGTPLIDGTMLGYITDAHAFRFMVKHAHETLSVEGERYNRSGYDGPQERFREVISRFAELKQVEYRDQPQLLHYLAPGLDDMFEQHYLPHLQRVYDRIGPQVGEGITTTKLTPPPTPPKPGHDTVAMAPPANDGAVGLVHNQPDTQTEPKVENRPVAATGKSAASDLPGTQIDAESILPAGLLQNDRTMAAMSAIQGFRH